MDGILPGLHDDLALLCLVRLPRGTHQVLRQVCKTWSDIFSNAEFYDRRIQLGLTEPWLYVQTRDLMFHDRFRAFDLLSKRWHLLPPFPQVGDGQVRDMGTATVRGKLYVFGGWKEGGPTLKETYCYDPRTNQWSRVSDMSVERCYMASSVIGDCIYVAGGRSRRFFSAEEQLETAEKFDPAENRWLPIPNMARRVTSCCGTAYKGQFFVSGAYKSEYQSQYQSQIQVFNVEKNEWSLVSSSNFTDRIRSPCVSNDSSFICMADALTVWNPISESWERMLYGISRYGRYDAIEISCLTFVKEDRLLLVRNNSGVIALDLKYTEEETNNEGQEETESERKKAGGRQGNEGRQLVVRCIEFMSNGGNFGEERVVNCYAMDL